MGKPLPPAALPASGTPPTGDQANAVVTGSIAALGPTAPFVFWGAFNVAIWAQLNDSLTTAAASTTAAVTTVVGVAVGQAINSTLVPQGATVGSVGSLTTITIAGLSTTQIAAIATGTDAAALFEPAVPTATVRLERSFDGGVTWITCGIGAGLPATFDLNALGGAVSIVVNEVERGCAYRLNCTAYSSGAIQYRMSASGLMALTLAPS